MPVGDWARLFVPSRGTETAQDDSRSSSDVQLVSQGGSASSSRGGRSRLVVAIDYGTTHNDGPDKGVPLPKAVRDWPQDLDLYKIPSDIAYSPGDGSQTRWGASIPRPDSVSLPTSIESNRNWTILRWTKLTLEHDRGASEEGRPSREARQMMMSNSNCPSDPIDVVRDYLRGLWGHVRVQIERDLESITSHPNLEKILVLTVPANWSIRATRRTYEAAKRAGLGEEFRLHILKEPEAAAIHILLGMEQHSRLNEGDCFIVCDAGGGTVDLVSYLVESSDPLRLKECTEATGSFCGSVNLDTMFEVYLRGHLGEERFDRISERNRFKIMRAWQKVKHEFNGEGPKYVEVEPEFSSEESYPALGVQSGLLKLDEATMKQLFDPICNEIKALIHGQNETLKREGLLAKAIIMVGGLSNNEHLFRTLEGRYAGGPGDDEGRCMKVFKPGRDDRSMSVSYGAVQIALNDLESTHMSPFNFGLVLEGGGIFWFIRRVGHENRQAKLRYSADSFQGDPMNPGKGKPVKPSFDIESANFNRDVKLKCEIVTSPVYNPSNRDVDPATVKPLVSFMVLLEAAKHRILKEKVIDGRRVKKENLDMEIHLGLRCITVKYGLEGEMSEIPQEIDYPPDYQ
ncbi:hypothetical protein GP486_006563 [Trichoglossum hirsutum]|uniref:Actin-like ATPase domain-containing protein n=1 Tax=Trichoglossum hirsutum TaxID=265104 RepID=A0A9P8IDH0_9PEZI|nr:hypothetical protein GP486_006563 [Trichoglossum hirsutum]